MKNKQYIMVKYGETFITQTKSNKISKGYSGKTEHIKECKSESRPYQDYSYNDRATSKPHTCSGILEI